MKTIIKKIFYNFGFDIHRIYYQRTTMSQVLEHIKNLGFNPNTIVDVGVAKGTYELYRAFPLAKFILIEPLIEFKNDLDKISRQYNADVIIAAAADKVGHDIIHVHNFLQASSLFKESEGSHVNGRLREIITTTIDVELEKRKLEKPYLIKMDVHGSEIIALKGALDALKNTEVIILETHFFKFFINGPQFYDIIDFMNSIGFCAYDIFSIEYRPYDAAVSSADIVFVKEAGFFRRSHFWANERQRKKIVAKLTKSDALNPKK